MPSSDSELSWEMLRRVLRLCAGDSAELAEVKPLVGGCINVTLRLTSEDGQQAVLKISPHRVNRDLAREAYQLRVLRQLGLPVPQVYAEHVADLDDPHSYVLMEYVQGVDLSVAREQSHNGDYQHLQEQLAAMVLRMHEHTAPAYARVMPDAPQFDSWPLFYRSIYDGIWKEVAKANMLPVKVRKKIDKLHERLDRYIAHGDQPRLLHWDLWSTNLLLQPQGDGWRIAAVLDPNCKYGHFEAEIAYLDLFHTITPAFLKAYQQVHKLDNGYHQVRKHVYQLYPMINHVRLFGHDYLKPLLQVAERVTALV
jgi:fructosamine-3-kinase